MSRRGPPGASERRQPGDIEHVLDREGNAGQCSEPLARAASIAAARASARSPTTAVNALSSPSCAAIRDRAEAMTALALVRPSPTAAAMA
jgi:hypothetical protein